MFREWLQTHDLRSIDLNGTVLPPAANRAVWAQVDASHFIEAAEALADFGWPTVTATDYMAFARTGNRLIMEDKHFARRRAFCTLVTAEVCEYRGRFTDGIINGLMAICEEIYWGVSAHYQREVRMIPDPLHPFIDLFAAETGANLALCLHLLENELAAVTPEIVLWVRRELDRRIVQPFLSHEDFHWMGYNHAVNNWNPWILSNIISVALFAVQDSVTRCEMLKKCLNLLDHYMATVPSDGGCDEGIGYWNVAAVAVFDAAFQLYLASNGAIDFFSEPLLRRMGDYACKVYLGNGWVAGFADGHARIPRPGFGTGMLYLFGKMTENPRLMGLGYEVCEETLSRELLNQSGLRRILVGATHPAKACAFEPEAHAVLDRLQIATMRTSGMTAVIKGGHNAEGHNHNDVGSFILFADRPVLIDAGVGVYTRQTFSSERYSIWTMQCSWHNLPEINGRMQPPGAQFRATDFLSENGRTSLNLTGAYPADAGLSSLIRTLSVSDAEAVLTDAYTFTAEHNTVTEHFLMREEPLVENGRICIGHHVIAYPACMTATVESQYIRDDRNLFNVWETDRLFRVSLRTEVEKAATLTFTVVKREAP